MIKILTLAICQTILLIISLPSIAYEITSFDVKEEKKQYDVAFTAELTIPSTNLLNYVRDIKNIALIIPSVETVEVLESSDGETYVNAVMKPCILYICKRLYKSSIIEMNDNGLTMIGLKNEGSFQFINESVVIKKIDEKNSEISYQSDFLPSFYIPGFIGVVLMKRSMHKYLVEFLQSLELKYSRSREVDQ